MTELLYQTDSYLKNFTASVVALDEDGRGIALDRTAFYPGGGGQPADSGSMTANSVTYPVKRAKKAGDLVFHYVESAEALPPIGADVQGQIDWERRYQLMRTHTAMHMLCGVIFRDYGASVTGGDMDPLQGPDGFRVRDHAARAGGQNPGGGQSGGGCRPCQCGWTSCRASRLSRSPT